MNALADRICVLCVAEYPHPPTEICTTEDIEETVKEVVANHTIGRPMNIDGSDMSDALSSGRKRAEVLLPTEVLKTMICEWALLKEAGGGQYPIKGCHGNTATDRHHGPDKNTLNNERNVNLHAICSFCHNRWHSNNDSTYEGERPKDATPWFPVGGYRAHNPDGPKMSVKEALIEELKRYK